MVRTGLDIISNKLPAGIRNRRIGVLCHASSVRSDLKHITDIIHENKECRLGAIFGPQHGIFGETQDNMIEWDSGHHPYFNVPVFSLYGKHRKPTPEMLDNIDLLLVDLQDVGARLYTYVWTVKLCIEACHDKGIPIWILDRPNPIGGLCMDGPVLKEDYFSFVGGASIPLCHKMTIGEIALWVKEKYFPGTDLHIVEMENWDRDMFYDETGLPWVIPSPNMPKPETALVYPGTVLIEALNISEGRGTTTPFELFGSPLIDSRKLKNELDSRLIPGCAFRAHNFIPTFHKYEGQLCEGIQIHITDRKRFSPVATALDIFDAIIKTSRKGTLTFNQPPYEYEDILVPFDILSGDSLFRTVLTKNGSLKQEKERWAEETELFKREFRELSIYQIL